ncbi:hypothetical protein [Streptomyces virginiae]|uniref:hypothetical protein n=1 Tax=Streptomyces virginiae TaxID=1961 RepID=UPI0036FB7286
MTDTAVPRDLLTGLPSRRKTAELIHSDTPSRDTFAGWQHFRATRGLLVPAQRLSVSHWRTLPHRRRDDYDTYQQMTNVNLPLQQTPMKEKVSRLIDRRLTANTRKKSEWVATKHRWGLALDQAERGPCWGTRPAARTRTSPSSEPAETTPAPGRKRWRSPER